MIRRFKMTLEQLGRQYLEEADRLKARLCELNIMLRRERDEEQRLQLKRRIYYLYTEMRDVEQTAGYLFDYYCTDREGQNSRGYGSDFENCRNSKGDRGHFDREDGGREYEKNNIA